MAHPVGKGEELKSFGVIQGIGSTCRGQQNQTVTGKRMTPVSTSNRKLLAVSPGVATHKMALGFLRTLYQLKMLLSFE
jgi:hypothetical protein